MAIFCKPHAVKARLDERINYAATADKTKALADKIEYAIDDLKTEQAIFASVINCDEVDTAFAEMNMVKDRFRKNGGVIGYTFIQSFSPDDKLTPEQAHEIGVRLAQEYFGERYQVVVGTHIDKAHLHNHFVINSVSFVDGHKYLNKLHYLAELRDLSDRLCLEYGLSVIEPKTKSSMESYSEWKDRKNGTPPPKDIMRTDIDECIRQSLTFNDFVAKMKARGYRLRYGPSIKHLSITPPGRNADGKIYAARRVYKLGDDYSEEAIKRRISENTPEQVKAALRAASEKNKSPQSQPLTVRAYRGGKRYSRKKLTGIQARYYRILYIFGMIRKKPMTQYNRPLYFSLYDQVRQFDGYIRQMRLLTDKNISTLEDLGSFRASVAHQIDDLVKQRTSLYKSRSCTPPKKEADAITVQIRALRRTLRDCDEIGDRSESTAQRVREAEAQTNAKRREVDDSRQR